MHAIRPRTHKAIVHITVRAAAIDFMGNIMAQTDQPLIMVVVVAMVAETMVILPAVLIQGALLLKMLHSLISHSKICHVKIMIMVGMAQDFLLNSRIREHLVQFIQGHDTKTIA